MLKSRWTVEVLKKSFCKHNCMVYFARSPSLTGPLQDPNWYHDLIRHSWAVSPELQLGGKLTHNPRHQGPPILAHRATVSLQCAMRTLSNEVWAPLFASFQLLFLICPCWLSKISYLHCQSKSIHSVFYWTGPTETNNYSECSSGDKPLINKQDLLSNEKIK